MDEKEPAPRDGQPTGEALPNDRLGAHYMYVVACHDGSWYTGYTTDVARRVAAHNAGKGARYTRVRGPVELVAAARFATKHEAMAAEYRFKRLDRAHKERLVEQAVAGGEPFEDVLAREWGGAPI